MKVNGEELKSLHVFPSMLTFPDCSVIGTNKLGRGNGEAKIYIASKKGMYEFYEFEKNKNAKCFVLKKDLISYLMAVKNEYMQPSQPYRGRDRGKEDMPDLWQERMNKVEGLNEVEFFDMIDQAQITGNRGYINSKDKAYQILRELALPNISYIYMEKVGNEKEPLFYWKLFVDFLAVNEIKNGAMVFKYGKKKNTDIDTEEIESKQEKTKKENLSQARNGQGKYREALLEQCSFCPFTKISDDRLLIASHIKPWAAANDKEKVDPFNGYMLSPMYDKLFDRGYITFTSDRHVRLSQFLSRITWKQIGLTDDTFIQSLLMDDKRAEYLKFHQENVFKGSLQ